MLSEIELVKNQEFELEREGSIISSDVRRVVLRCKEGGPSEEFGAENYCLCYLDTRRILINCCYLKVKESSSVEISIKSQ